MNAQHTPGPWHNNGLDVWADYTDEHGNRHHCHVAAVTNRNEINRGPSMEEYKSARLIAAAPDLLAALENLTAAAEYLRDTNRLPQGYMDQITRGTSVLDDARAVIARAKGE